MRPGSGSTEHENTAHGTSLRSSSVVLYGDPTTEYEEPNNDRHETRT